ncbi:MAG: hypothetical protein GY749_19180, partial [Desulfobacteraceae bacterium]|nr:hypothetical protein [Desulfobacteraceae bacterium]
MKDKLRNKTKEKTGDVKKEKLGQKLIEQPELFELIFDSFYNGALI